MKVVFLGPAGSIHTQRWVEALDRRGLRVVLATQHDSGEWQAPPGVQVCRLPHSGNGGYFANAPALRRLLAVEKPDLVNAHYASGYGTTAALARFEPTLLSVWGSDVFEFPHQSWLKGALVRWNLRSADAVASTSEAMAHAVGDLVPALRGRIHLTPFGVDIRRFDRRARQDNGNVTIGTVKSLADCYGIDLLIRAYARLKADPDIARANLQDKLRLLIVGGGPQREELEALVRQLGVQDTSHFVGRVPHDDVPEWLGRLDIYAAPSRSESFGVAVIEASACGVPVVVSDVGGLPEVVSAGRTGLVVERENVAALADAFKQLVLDPARRQAMGDAGRTFVVERYEWALCVDRMIRCYEAVIAGAAAGGA